VPAEPTYGSWGGRFQRFGAYYGDAKDQVETEHSGIATVWRWREAFQNEFQARMDWCLSSYPEANHLPIAVVNGDRSKRILHYESVPGNIATFDASDSIDPDGDALRYNWWIYHEAGTYPGTIQLEQNSEPSITLVIPKDVQPGQQIHLILEVIDDGEPPLTAYRRIVIYI
jgi:hypothetical protein